MHWYELLGEPVLNEPILNEPILNEPMGSPLFLIPGVNGQGIEWDDPFCALLVERGFRVIRYDLRDSGLSEYLEHASALDAVDIASGHLSNVPYTVDDMADDAADLLTELGVDAAHVVGQSLGGMIAQSLAIRHPERVLTMTSVSSTTGDPSVGKAREARLLTDKRRTSIDRQVAIEAHVATRRVQYGNRFDFDEVRVRALVGRMYDRAHYPAGRLRHLAAAIAAPDRTEQLQALDVPTLIVHGTDDPVIDVSGGNATANAIPNAAALIIRGMGHNMAPEVWADVADAISNLTAN